MVERLLTPDQVADILQVGKVTVYRWLRKGMLPGVHIGRTWRVKAAALEAFVDAGGSGQKPKKGRRKVRRRSTKGGRRRKG